MVCNSSQSQRSFFLQRMILYLFTDVLRGSKFLENDLGITERQSDVSIIQYFEALHEEDASAHDNVSSMLTRPELLRHHNLVKRLLQTKVTLDKRFHYPLNLLTQKLTHMFSPIT